METDGIPLARVMRIVVAVVFGAIGVWAYYNKKEKEEIEAWRKKTEDEDKKREEKAGEDKQQRHDGSSG